MDRLNLILGEELNIGKLKVRHPTLRDIKEYNNGNENKYMMAIHNICLAIDLESIAHILWVENKMWYKDIDPWDLFISSFQADMKMKDILKWWTGLDFYVLCSENEKPYLYNKENDIILDKKIMPLIVKYIKEINYMPVIDKAKRKFTNREKTAKKYYERLYQKLKQKTTEPDSDFASIISAVSCRMQCSPNDFLDYKIYQIWDRFYRLGIIDNYKHLMLGFYTGNIKKKSLKDRDLNWIRIINIDRSKQSESGNATFKIGKE